MAFSVSGMLEMPGHDDVPDHATIEYLRQTQYNGSRSDDPFSYDSSHPASIVSYPLPSVRGGRSSREVHGRPVPGDRDFRRSKQSIDTKGRGFDSLFLSEDSAPERFEEMRKMLRIMMSTHEKKFGSRNARDRLKQELGVFGLEDEHKQYVERLENEWRAVGKILRCKPKETHEESGECCVSDGSSHIELESGYSSEILEVDGPASSFKHDMPVGSGKFSEESHSGRVCDEKVKEVVEDEPVVIDNGSAKAKGIVLVQSDDYTTAEDKLSESIRARAKDIDDGERGGPVTAVTNSSNVGTRGRISAGRTDELLWRESSSEAESSNAHDGVDILEKSIDNETISPDSVKREQGFDSHPAGDAHSLASNEMSSELSIRGLEEEEIRVRVPSAKGFRRSSSKFTPPQSLVIPTDPENPLDSSSHLRTADRRNSDTHSPLYDLSNEQRRNPRRLADEGRRQKQNPSWVSGLKTPEKSPKRVLTMEPRRKAEFRGNQIPSNAAEDLPDLPTIPKPRFQRSASEKVEPRLTAPRGKTGSDALKALAEASQGPSESSNQLDIPPLPTLLSPIRVERTEKACGVSEPRHASCSVCAARHAASGGERSPLGKSGSRSPYSPHQSKAGRSIFGAPDASPKQSTVKKSSGIYTPLTGTKKSNVVLKTNSSRLSSSVDLTDADKNYRRQGSMRMSEESSRSTGVQGSSNESSRSGHVDSPTLTRSITTWNDRGPTLKEKLTPGGPRRSGKVDRVARFAEMQNLWKNDKFLNASGKRKTQSFYRIFSELHESHERFYAAYRERCGLKSILYWSPEGLGTAEVRKELVTLIQQKPVPDGATSKNEQPPFVVPIHSTSERIRSPRAFLYSVN